MECSLSEFRGRHGELNEMGKEEEVRDEYNFWRVSELILCYVNLLKTTEMKFWYSAARKIPFNTPTREREQKRVCREFQFVYFLHLPFPPLSTLKQPFLVCLLFPPSALTLLIQSCCGRLKYLNDFDEHRPELEMEICEVIKFLSVECYDTLISD